MKVLTYTSLFPNSQQPGLGIFVQQRMAHFAEREGNRVTAVAPLPYAPGWFPGRQKQLSLIPCLEQIGKIEVHHPRYPLMPKISMTAHGLLMAAGSWRTVRQLHAREKFDLIDAHYVYPDGFAAALIAKRLKLPLFLSARGTDMNLFPAFRTIRPMIQWTLRQAAACVGVSEALALRMIAYGAARERVHVISNGVDLARFHPVPQAEARKHLNLDPRARILISIAALEPHKGGRVLIEALPKLADQRPVLYLIGEGSDRDHLERMASQFGVEERVQFLGARPHSELKFWFSAADVSCLASSREGMPNAVLEALACGTPVVATRIGGVPEALTHSALGLMVEAPDARLFAEALERALQIDWNREAIAQQGRLRSWDRVAAELESIFANRSSALLEHA